jgi:hypothetical protein
LSEIEAFELELLEPEGLAKSFTKLKRIVYELQLELIAEREGRIQADIDTLQAAKDYADQLIP